MANERIPPRTTLAKNLAALLKEHKMSAPELARKAGVDRKTINNQLNGRHNPRLEEIDAVANVFNLTARLILSEHLDPRRIDKTFDDLLQMYQLASDTSRESILRVAQMAQNHKN